MRLEEFLKSWKGSESREVEVIQLEGILVSAMDGFHVSTEDIDSYKETGITINDSELLPRLNMGVSGFGGGSYCAISTVVVSGKVVESSRGLELSSVSSFKCFPYRDGSNYKQDFYPTFPQLPNSEQFFCRVAEGLDVEEASLVGVLTFRGKAGLISYRTDAERIESVVLECEKLDTLLCAYLGAQKTWPTWILPVFVKGSFRSTRKGKCLAMWKRLTSITVLESDIGMALTLKL